MKDLKPHRPGLFAPGSLLRKTIDRLPITWPVWAVSRLPPSVLARLARLGRSPVPLERADLEKIFRDLRELETFPTVAAGMRALGMRSLLEWWLRGDAIAGQASPYTDPAQRPYLFFPGLRARAFWERDELGWVGALEAAVPAMRAELAAVLAQAYGFQPYRAFETPDARPRLEGPAWNQLILIANNRVDDDAARMFPRTLAAIRAVPRFRGLGLACVSALDPGARIWPHCGPINGVLRVHVGLLVPDGCTLRVGERRRTWREGEALVFDDSFEHEVWQEARSTRFVLLFDVWHPDWTEAEVERLEAMYGAEAFRAHAEAERRGDRELLRGKRWWV